jgi:ATP-dependent DNA helicase
LVEGVLDHSGTYHYIDEDGAERLARSFIDPLPDDGSRRILIPLVRRLTGEGKKMIVFRATKSESVACAV